MGNLQREKSGRWTLRVGIGGKRLCRSTGTTDLDEAERFAQRFLSPMGLGPHRLPLREVWFEYERSPKRRDLANSTLLAKRQVWVYFSKWMETFHLDVSELGQLTSDMIGEYLRALRINHSASTYNNHVCVLREICRTVSDKAGMTVDPWEGVRLLSDDSHTRREFTMDEVRRILHVVKDGQAGGARGSAGEWQTLFLIGLYTGLRLGDCCTLEWSHVNVERALIQLIPRKTRKHAHGRPVTIPIHPVLMREFMGMGGEAAREGYVLPMLADWYVNARWRVSEGLKRIFAKANVTTSIRVEGRRYKAPEATFHSLRHTFVSLAANAGVPLTVVQSIVGHSSTTMTRHYYHENEAALKSVLAALPNFGADEVEPRQMVQGAVKAAEGACSVSDRLKALGGLYLEKAITRREYKATRERILATL